MSARTASSVSAPPEPQPYFATVRREIEALLPERADRVLEVGCGAGATLAWLRERWPAAWLAGADVNAEQVAVAAQRADHAERCDLDEALPAIAPESVDLLLCLDVLEHLRDPWGALAALRALVRPGGTLIVSVPNVRHASVVWPLLRAGRFRYGGSGILDRTHLRFFTRESAVALVRDAGFDVRAVRGLGTERGKRGHALHLATFGLFRDFLTRQYLVQATRPAP
jgi:2-polyprenyl-3-methyl-5-hydroxy-6-metoxy-1,4-benzoquinol methylase